jgi:hypothetical protein
MKKVLGLLLAALPLLAQVYEFSAGGRPIRLESAPNETYVGVAQAKHRGTAITQIKKAFGADVKSTTEVGETGFLAVFSKPAREAAQALHRGKARVEGVISSAPVFYESSEGHGDAGRRIVTSKLLVKLAGNESWKKLQQSTTAPGHTDSLLNGWSLVEYGDPYTALDAAVSLVKAGGWEFTPVLARQFKTRQASASGPLQRPVNDPLFPNQWNLAGTFPNIKMNSSWDVVTGKGINVVVVDDGLDVAPEARLMGIALIGGPSSDDSTGAALAWQPAGLVSHVSNNSWGPSDNALGQMGPLQIAGLQQAATTYRNGLGTVFVVAAGNARLASCPAPNATQTCPDDASYDDFGTSRFAIDVAAANQLGNIATYSTPGVSIAVTAFGGDDPNIWTVNNTGPGVGAAPPNYSDSFNGTSAATPQVAGAAALLLQRNPNLGYREVKEILMRTATKTDLKGGDPFLSNGSGFSFSRDFGAGLLNVAAALDLAVGWTNLGPLTSVSVPASNPQAIPDGSQTGASSSFDFSALQRLRMEHVEFTVNITPPGGEISAFSLPRLPG